MWASLSVVHGLYYCVLETHTAVVAPVSSARQNLTHTSTITLSSLQLFRKGAEDDAWTFPSSAFSPWHCPPAQRPHLHFRYYSVLGSEPQMHKGDCLETLVNIIVRWLEFVSDSDRVCLYCSVLWYPTKYSHLWSTCRRNTCKVFRSRADFFGTWKPVETRFSNAQQFPFMAFTSNKFFQN